MRHANALAGDGASEAVVTQTKEIASRLPLHEELGRLGGAALGGSVETRRQLEERMSELETEEAVVRGLLEVVDGRW
jgi:hypothetical protein